MQNDEFKERLQEAKRRLPLPQLLQKIGDGPHAEKSAHCPFHQDSRASFSIFKNESGVWLWKCHAGCGDGDEVDYLVKRFNLSKGDAIFRLCHEAGLNGATQKTQPAFDWNQCVAAFTDADAQRFADQRGIQVDFFKWLHAESMIGLYESKVTFPVRHGGKIVACHWRVRDGLWYYNPKGSKVAPLIFGDVRHAGFIFVFESQWDAFAVMDKLGWHIGDGMPKAAVFITRGSANGKLIRDQLSGDAVVYAFKQNDTLKDGQKIPAGDKWLADVAAQAGCKVFNVVTPSAHKDANDWTRAGASREEIEAAIKTAALVSPPLDVAEGEKCQEVTSDIRGEILATLTNSKLTPPEQRTKIANAVVSALSGRGQFFFHAERKDFDSAVFFDGQRKQLLRVRSDDFLAWLAEWLAVNKADPIFKYIAAQVETTALAGPQTKAVLPESFWASRPGAIYLSNGNGRMAKITVGNVELVDNGTDGVLFAAGNTLAEWELTAPKNPFETCSLFSGANCAASHGHDLLRLWVFSLPTNPASKPPLCLAGDIGSGKTRLAKGVAELYGLPFVANKVEDGGENSFWTSLDAGGLFTLDNCDTRNKWLPDAVASAATDGCSQRRKLYTNSERVTFRARAWLALTTANATFASDSGLADRLVLARMNRRTGETSDENLSAEIKLHRNAGLSFIAYTLAAALADKQPTPGGLNQRHPDFATFAVRIGRALGRERETVNALKLAEQDKSLFCLEQDPIATVLQSYLANRETFTGTAGELRQKLIEADTELAILANSGKFSTKRLGKRIAALWPHLEKVLATAKQEKDRKGFTIYTLKAKPADYAEFQTPI